MRGSPRKSHVPTMHLPNMATHSHRCEGRRARVTSPPCTFLIWQLTPTGAWVAAQESRPIPRLCAHAAATGRLTLDLLQTYFRLTSDSVLTWLLQVVTRLELHAQRTADLLQTYSSLELHVRLTSDLLQPQSTRPTYIGPAQTCSWPFVGVFRRELQDHTPVLCLARRR